MVVWWCALLDCPALETRKQLVAKRMVKRPSSGRKSKRGAEKRCVAAAGASPGDGNPPPQIGAPRPPACRLRAVSFQRGGGGRL